MGIETAIIGSAILGAGASLVGANKQSKAASQAAAAQTDAADRQIDLSREIYYDQRGLQQPFYQAGLQGLYGSSGVMNLLGMGQPAGTQSQPTAQQSPGNAFAQYASGTYGQAPVSQPQQTPSGPNWQAYLDANPDVAQWAVTASQQPHFTKGAGRAADTNRDGTLTPQEMAAYHYQQYGQSEGRQVQQFQPQQAQPASGGSGVPSTVNVGGGAAQAGGQAQPMVEAGPATPAQPAEGPMTQTLRQTPGYMFMQDEGKRQLENSFASRGKLLSGSAMKALQERSMGLADQTYQQSVQNAFNLTNIGMGSAAQIQGAGNNYGNMAGNAFANMGNAAANRAYGKADAWNAGLQGVANAAGQGLGMYGGYKGWFQ